jgi:hypothetical protein
MEKCVSVAQPSVIFLTKDTKVIGSISNKQDLELKT